MNKTSIEFADFTWNPIVGCQIGCPYCWARKFHKRYFQGSFDIPVFHEERMTERVPAIPKMRNDIAKAISPDKPVVFSIDMGDIFGPTEKITAFREQWICNIIERVKSTPAANFLFLTKNPRYYMIFGWPDNVILGTSIEKAQFQDRIHSMKLLAKRGHRVFINLEPILSTFHFVDFSGIEFLIVGALTGQKYKPNPAFHESIQHDRVFYKQNYLKYFPTLKQPWSTSD